MEEKLKSLKMRDIVILKWANSFRHSGSVDRSVMDEKAPDCMVDMVGYVVKKQVGVLSVAHGIQGNELIDVFHIPFNSITSLEIVT